MKEGLPLDTDILVDVLRNFSPTIQLLSKVSSDKQLQISILTEMEIVAGCRNKIEVERAALFLKRFETILPCDASLHRASELIRAHRLEHGLSIPDAIIAATAIQRHTLLLTRNQKHFRNVAELSLFDIETTT